MCFGVAAESHRRFTTGVALGKGGDTQKIFVPDTCGYFNKMQYLSVRMEITVVKGIISLIILFLPEKCTSMWKNLPFREPRASRS